MACNDVTEDMIEIPENAAFTSRQARTINELRLGDEMTDFTVISEGQHFSCHGVMLASSSEMLRSMFQTAMMESTKREMELPTVPPNIVKSILEYIYTKTIRVPSHLLLATIEAANFLHLYELKDDCLQRYQRVLNPSNVISWHKLARNLNIEELKQSSSKLLSSSLNDIAESLEFQKLPLAELTSYLSDIKESDVDSDDQIEAVVKWIRHDQGSRKKDMQNLVHLVDLNQCSIQCIEEAIRNHSDLLDREMCLKFAQSLATIGQQCPARKKRRGREKMLVIIAGHTTECWCVDESMTVTELCKDFPCADWYSACKVPLGFVLTGGAGSVLCMMYVASSQSWIKLTSMQAPRKAHASIFIKGKLFVFGGLVSNQRSRNVQALKLDGEWMDEQDLPVAPHLPEVAQINGTIYLLHVETNQLLCLDDKKRVWNEMAKYPFTSKACKRMASMNGQLLVAGDNTCAQYTPANDTWITCSVPSEKHHLGALICHNNKIYLMGGKNTTKVEEYDLASDQWSTCFWELPKEVYNLYAIIIDAD